MKTLIIIGVVIATVAAILAMTDKTSLFANGQESQEKTITFTDTFLNQSADDASITISIRLTKLLMALMRS